MKNTRYLILFAVAALLLIYSWPTVDDYLETLDTNRYINPTSLQSDDDAESASGDVAEDEDADEDSDDGDDDAEATTGDTATGDTAEEGDEDEGEEEEEGDDEEGDEDADGEEEGDEDTEDTTSAYNGYVAFTPDALAKGLAENKNVALFFHADRCPSCVALDADITANDGATADDQVILKVNYDEAEELKKQYNVVKQHTIVYLDNNGNSVNVDTTAMTLEDLVSNY